jgi:hypothetical protein
MKEDRPDDGYSGFSVGSNVSELAKSNNFLSRNETTRGDVFKPAFYIEKGTQYLV